MVTGSGEIKMKFGPKTKKLYLFVFFFLFFSAFSGIASSQNVDPTKGWHNLSQIAIGVGSNYLKSVDANRNGAIDTSEACNGSSSNICETSPQINIGGSYALIQALNNNLELKTYASKNILLTPGSGGNVGIGTASPSYKLDVVGKTRIKASDETAQGLLMLEPSGGTSHSWDFGFDSATDPNLWLQHDQAAPAVMYWSKGGNVGMGTTSPSTRLDVAGYGSFNNQINIREAGLGWAQLQSIGSGLEIKAGANNILLTTPGNVGIGISSPGHKLDVAGQINGSGLCINNDCRTGWQSVTDTRCDVAGVCSQVCIGSSCQSSWPTDTKCNVSGSCSQVCIGTDCRTVWPTGNVTGSGSANYIAKWTGTGSLGISSMYQDTSGNIGIGTSAPTEKLDVNGSINASGTICDGEGHCIGDIGATCAEGSFLQYSQGVWECVSLVPILNESSRCKEIYNSADYGVNYLSGSGFSGYVDALESHNGYILAGARNNGLYKKNSDKSWTQIYTYNDDVKAIKSHNGKLWVAVWDLGAYRVYKYTYNGEASLPAAAENTFTFPYPVTAMAEFDGRLFAAASDADNNNGYIFVLVDEGTPQERFIQFLPYPGAVIDGGVTLTTYATSAVGYVYQMLPATIDKFGNSDPKLLITSKNSVNLMYIRRTAANTYVLTSTQNLYGSALRSMAVFNSDIFAGTNDGGLVRVGTTSCSPFSDCRTNWWYYGDFSDYAITSMGLLSSTLYVGGYNNLWGFLSADLDLSRAKWLNLNLPPSSGTYLSQLKSSYMIANSGTTDTTDGTKPILKQYILSMLPNGASELYLGSNSYVTLLRTPPAFGTKIKDLFPAVSASAKWEVVDVPDFCMQKVCYLQVYSMQNDANTPSGLSIYDAQSGTYNQADRPEYGISGSRWTIFGRQVGTNSYTAEGVNGNGAYSLIFNMSLSSSNYLQVRDDQMSNVYVPGSSDTFENSSEAWAVIDNSANRGLIMEACPLSMNIDSTLEIQ
jgi:hypothetical protein